MFLHQGRYFQSCRDMLLFALTGEENTTYSFEPSEAELREFIDWSNDQFEYNPSL